MIGLIVKLFFAFFFIFSLFWLIEKDSLFSGHIPEGCEANPTNQTSSRIIRWGDDCYSKQWTGWDSEARGLPFSKGANTYEEITWKASSGDEMK